MAQLQNQIRISEAAVSLKNVVFEDPKEMTVDRLHQEPNHSVWYSKKLSQWQTSIKFSMIRSVRLQAGAGRKTVKRKVLSIIIRKIGYVRRPMLQGHRILRTRLLSTQIMGSRRVILFGDEVMEEKFIFLCILYYYLFFLQLQVKNIIFTPTFDLVL